MLAALWYGPYVLGIGAAEKARRTCNGVFLSIRESSSVLATDAAADDLSILRSFAIRIDPERRSVTADFHGATSRTAVYRPGLGCILVIGGLDRSLSDAQLEAAAPATRAADEPWPAGDLLDPSPLPREVDPVELESALGWAFSEPDPAHLRRTRAVVVVYKGRIVAERYAAGFTRDMPLAGWSMAKGITNALVGILIQEQKLFLDGPAPVPEWQRPDDPRRGITLDQLLRMTSGLQFDEDSGSLLSDDIRMLLGVADSARYAAGKPLIAPPGTRWSYSSGASQIISGIIRRTIADDRRYLEFPRRALFDRIGMRTAVMAPDASGTFVGSSFVFASARDWARLGLLYLRDGVWNGERVLPEGWVAYTTRRTTAAPRRPYGTYGAHFWLTSPRDLEGGAVPSQLPDSFSAIGHEAQYLTVVPSRDLVIVRLGLTRYFTAWDQRMFLERVLKAVSGP